MRLCLWMWMSGRSGRFVIAIAVVGMGIAALGVERPSVAARADFVGTDACGRCHPEELQVWKTSAHAGASETLGAEVGNRRCLACHATGEAPAGRPYGSGVGCESCHGAGAGYSPRDVMRSPVLARELGLRQLGTAEARRALCASCHRARTRLVPFDADRAWKKIAH